MKYSIAPQDLTPIEHEILEAHKIAQTIFSRAKARLAKLKLPDKLPTQQSAKLSREAIPAELKLPDKVPT